MKRPCLVNYLFEVLLDCGWSGLLYVDGSSFPAFLTYIAH